MDNLQLKTPVSECSFTKRTQTVLKDAGVKYLEELSNMYNTNMLIKNIRLWKNAGRKTLVEIEQKIKKKGLSYYHVKESDEINYSEEDKQIRILQGCVKALAMISERLDTAFEAIEVLQKRAMKEDKINMQDYANKLLKLEE
tara:strand:- start:4153 stop:4578 length:426 start_codon:yes stop_codon:yes gene_type:complete